MGWLGLPNQFFDWHPPRALIKRKATSDVLSNDKKIDGTSRPKKFPLEIEAEFGSIAAHSMQYIIIARTYNCIYWTF